MSTPASNLKNLDPKIKREPNVTDDLAEALGKIAWGGWNPGQEEEAALEHIRIAVKALKDSGYLDNQ